jgi:hypothetical protein
MELYPFFKSIIDQDRCPVVICNLDHTIIYVNPAGAENYQKYGPLTGRCLLNCHNSESQAQIRRVVQWFADSPDHQIVHTFYHPAKNRDVYMVALRDEIGRLIGYYEKHEYRNQDMMPLYDLT